jgi:hypothetical protein
MMIFNAARFESGQHFYFKSSLGTRAADLADDPANFSRENNGDA